MRLWDKPNQSSNENKDLTFTRVHLLTSSPSFITFYPFCVVFTLYEYILACPNPEDCESDIVGLENIGLAMTEACVTSKDLAPFAKTINALNRVSRTLQEERRKNMTATRSTGGGGGRGEETQYQNATPVSYTHL